MSKTNVETIIKSLNKINGIESLKKLDGITIECTFSGNEDDVQTQLKNECKKLKLPQALIEQSKIDPNKYALQFPELVVYYNDSEFKKLIYDAFDWLVNNMKFNDTNNVINKQVMLDNIGMITKLTIDIYYKSNVNKYKTKIEDLLNDKDFRDKINNMFKEYVNTLERGDI